MEIDNQILFDSKDEIVNELFKFIEGTLAKGESILIHSLKGQNRSVCVMVVYFMKKYRWSLHKCLEFLYSKKPNIEIQPSFYNQIVALENKFIKTGMGPKTQTWNEVGHEEHESDERVLANTFLNSKKLPLADFTNVSSKEKQNKLDWADIKTAGVESKAKLTTSMGPNEQIKNTNPPKSKIKSILKGSDKVFILREEESAEKLNTDSSEHKFVTTLKPLPVFKDGQRPGSHSNNLTKSNSTSVLEKVDKGDNSKNQQNVQGNIIHITVNNYITNNTIKSVDGSDINNPLEKSDTKKEKNPIATFLKGISDVNPNKKSGPIILPNKRPDILQPTSLPVKSMHTKQASEPQLREKLENGGQSFNRIKFNNFTADSKSFPKVNNAETNPHIGVFAPQGLKGQQIRIVAQKDFVPQNQPIKANGLLPKKHGHSSSYTEFVAQFNNLRNSQSSNDLLQAFNPIDIKVPSYSQQQFHKMQLRRPPTAPENTTKNLKKFMHESPYYSHNNNNNNSNTDRPSKRPESQHVQIRELSLQPPKDLGGSAKNFFQSQSTKMRSTSPGSFLNLRFLNDPSKPKWKF
jgi:hypothetical protein